MLFALNSFFRPILGLHRERFWTRLKPNFHTIDIRYNFSMIDLIFIASIDEKNPAMALLANVSTKWEPVGNEQPEKKCELFLGTIYNIFAIDSIVEELFSFHYFQYRCGRLWDQQSSRSFQIQR